MILRKWLGLISGFMLLSAGAAQALPSDEQFEALRTAPSAEYAEPIAEDILTALMESGSPTADLVFERALEAERAGATEIARELFDRVVVIRPAFSEAWFRRAMLFMADDAYDQAILDLNEALTIEPRNYRAWMALGGIFSSFGEDAQALEAYREVVRIHPFFSPAVSEIRRLEAVVEGRAI